MPLGESVALLIREEFNLLLTETMQLCICKKEKNIKSLLENNEEFIKELLEEIIKGNVKSAHMSSEKAEIALRYLRYISEGKEL